MTALDDRLTQASDEARLQINRIDARSAASIRSRRRHSQVLVVAAVMAAMLVVVGAGALVMSTDMSLDSASGPTMPSAGLDDAPDVVTADATPATPLPPVASDITYLVDTVSASSELSTAFGADMLIDGDLDSGWHDASLRGIGAEITMVFTEPVAISEIIVHPYSDEERFALHYWIDTLEIRTNDLDVAISGRFPYAPQPQALEMNTNETFIVTLAVALTAPAEPYGENPPSFELAIAEIQVFGTPTSAAKTVTQTPLVPATTTTVVTPSTPQLSSDPEAVSNWLALAAAAGGEPVRDDDIGWVRVGSPGFVPGSGFMFGLSVQDTLPTYEVGMVMFVDNDFFAPGQMAYCRTDYAIDGERSVVGSTGCYPDASELLSPPFGFASGGSCVPSRETAPMLTSVWGLPETTTEVQFEIGDDRGQIMSVPATASGTAQIVTIGQFPVWSVSFDGITSDHQAWLDGFLPTFEDPEEVCS